MSRNRVLLATAAAAITAAVAVGLVVGGVFRNHSSTHRAVARYITSVDTVQQQMRVPLTRLLAAYHSFSTRPGSVQTAKELAAAEQTLRTLERRLAALPAPPAAAKLRLLIVRLVAAELGGARDVDELAHFLPRFGAVAAAAKVAGTKLARALAAAQAPKPPTAHGTAQQVSQEAAAYAAVVARAARAQADAVDAYDRALGLVLGRLRAVKPPALMAPAYQAQVRTFVATRTAGTALVRELRTKNRARVALLSRRFAEAERIAAGVVAQRAEIAAIKAYNARVRAISALEAQIQSEVTRLQSVGD